jgi:hypothetical protein
MYSRLVAGHYEPASIPVQERLLAARYHLSVLRVHAGHTAQLLNMLENIWWQGGKNFGTRSSLYCSDE